MSDPEIRHGWPALPKPLRRAVVLAVGTVLIASGVLYQTNVRAKRPPDFSRGGTFAQGDKQPVLGDDLSIETPTPPVPSNRLRSSAVLTAPNQPGALPPGGAGAPDFPILGRYVYSVDGYESVTAFGPRDYPSEMTMTVHRAQDAPQPLKEDELVFDLKFSEEHEEREIVSYRQGGIFFTYESGSITFGPQKTTRSSEADYRPPMLQIPVPLKVGEENSGFSRALDPDTGAESRTEDWTVKVQRREQITVLNRTVDAWVVQIDRQSRPGSAESVTRSRTYWFDPVRNIWVKWHETLNGSQDFGPGTFTYSTDFTATLSRIEPL
jgi:hypothetical protein